nr:efflux RND transporter permease subunit [Burkholderiales bacterium]
MWLTRVSIKNPYFATVLMLALLIVGLIAANRISVEEFPDIKYPYVVITTTYSGASPEVIETDISRPIEEAINTLNGIKEIRSYSMDGVSTVVAEFNLNINPDIAAQDVRDKVAVVGATLRKGIDTPVVSRVSNQDKPIVKISISSNDMSLRDITTWVSQVAKKRLQTVPGVGDVAIVGGVDRQVRINIDPYKLQALGLSVVEVVSAIKNANNDYPAGFVKAENQNINVRLSGKLQLPADFANVVITVRKNVPIRISDVAVVEDGQDEYKSLSLLNDKRAIGLDIRQADKTNLVDVSNGVFAMIKELNLIKPAGIKILVTYDQSKSIKRSLNNVKENMIEGALLTVLIVFLFLKSWRSTVITGLTLPISLIGTIFAIYICGFTLNMMSLLALSLSVGLLIDDSIVVRENIVRHLHMGKDHYNAALDGTNEIGLAVLATTMTVVAVFLPVGFMQGIIGKFFYQFGITVAVAVLISLLVSFTLDPMLSSVWHEPKDGGFIVKTFIGKILNNFENAFNKLIIFYEKFIRLSLNYKKTTLGIAFGILISSCLLVPFIGGEFIPKQDKGKY